MNMTLSLKKTALVWSLLPLALLAGCASKPIDPPAALVAFKPALTVSTAWSTDIGKAGFYTFAPAVVGSNLYVAAANGNIGKLDGTNGNFVWESDADAKLTAGVGADDDTVAVVAAKGIVKAFDANNGKFKWQAQAPSDVLSPPLVTSNLVIVRSIDKQITAYDAKTGEQRWTLQRPVPSLTLQVAPAFKVAGPLTVMGLPAGQLIAIETTSGSIAWEVQVAQPVGATDLERLADIPGSPAISGPEVCAAAYQGKLTCYAVQNGAPVWSRDFATRVGLALDSNAVYAINDKSHVYAYSATNGQNLWKNDQLGFRSLSSPLDTGRALVTGDFEGEIHFLSLEDGSFLARVPTDGSPILTPPVMLGDNVVVQTQKGHIYALKMQ